MWSRSLGQWSFGSTWEMSCTLTIELLSLLSSPSPHNDLFPLLPPPCRYPLPQVHPSHQIQPPPFGLRCSLPSLVCWLYPCVVREGEQARASPGRGVMVLGVGSSSSHRIGGAFGECAMAGLAGLLQLSTHPSQRCSVYKADIVSYLKHELLYGSGPHSKVLEGICTLPPPLPDFLSFLLILPPYSATPIPFLFHQLPSHFLSLLSRSLISSTPSTQVYPLSHPNQYSLDLLTLSPSVPCAGARFAGCCVGRQCTP